MINNQKVMTNLFYILLFLHLLLHLLLAQFAIGKDTDLTFSKNKKNENVVAIVNDYTMVNKVSTSDINVLETTFELQEFKQKEKERKKEIVKNVLNKWTSNFYFYFVKIENNEESDLFENRIQLEVDLLNRLIINATDGLLNMCDNMIAKTTSSLPLSYSSYTQFETEMRFLKAEDDSVVDDDSSSGFFSFFSSTKKKDDKSVAVILDKEDLKDEVRKQMYDYQQYRLGLNNRQSFLNGLCFNTFGDPYTLYYNSSDNTLLMSADLKPLQYYIVIVQNVIDNSFIRGLNKGFKDLKKGQDNDFKYDIEHDSNKEKKEILVEKAKYILPILQKLEQRLPSYLSNIGKRSLTTDEYFANLRHFWTNILEEANIAAQDSPSKYEAKKEQERKAYEEKEQALKKAQLFREETDKKAQLFREETDKKAQLFREETDKKAQLEAERVIQEFKNKQLKKDAEDYIRGQEIILKDRRQNYSIMEWQQLKKQIKLQVSGFTGSLVSGVDGIIKVPVDYILGFASETIWDLGVMAIMVLVLISICLRIYNKVMSMVFFSEVKTK